MVFTKYLLLFSVFVLFAGFVNAVSFAGLQYTFKDIGLQTSFASGECAPLKLTPDQKTGLQSNKGVLGLLLHIKSEVTSDDFVFVKYGPEKEKVVYHRSIFGFGISYRNFLDNAQKNYLYIDLESIKLSELDLYLCTGGVSVLEFFDDSAIGSYKLPYFGGDNFKKEFGADNYKINEKTPINVTLRNGGYADTNVFLFYDNEIFKKWFKLKEGTPSLNTNVAPGKIISLTYNFVPLTSQSFTISPAIVRYAVNDYVFIEYSNSLISDARNYLDEIFVTLTIPNKNLDYNQEGTIELKLMNDSENEKDVVLVISGLDKFGLDEKHPLSLKAFETKELSFKISSAIEQVVTLNISLITTDKSGEKDYGSQTVYVGQPIQSNTYLIILFVVVIVILILLYYKYLL